MDTGIVKSSTRSRESSGNAHLLIVSDSFLPRWDGVSRFLVEMAPAVSKAFRTTLLAPHFRGKEPHINGIEINLVPTLGMSVGDYQPPKPSRPLIRRLIDANDIIWVHTQGPLGNYAINYARKRDKRIVTFVHSVEWELFSKSLPRNPLFQFGIATIAKRYIARNYNRCDLLIVPGEETERHLESIGVRTRKEVVYLGTNVKTFRPPRNKAQAKERIGIDSSKLVIGYVGRIGREKDLPTLHTAFTRLKEQYPDMILMIIGAGNQREEERLIGEDIMHLGRMDNVAPYLRGMDIYVLPSLTETSSLSTMEAMASGLGVITTPVGHIPEYITHEENGLFFEPGDVDALMARLRRLIGDARFRRKLGRNARKTIVSRYQFKHTEKQIIDILHEEVRS